MEFVLKRHINWYLSGIAYWLKNDCSFAFSKKDMCGNCLSSPTTTAFFALQVAVLVFANWAPASAEDSAVWHAIFAWKWPLTALAGVGLAGLLVWRWRWRWQPLAVTAAVVAVLTGFVPHHPELAFSAGLIGLTLTAALQPRTAIP